LRPWLNRRPDFVGPHLQRVHVCGTGGNVRSMTETPEEHQPADPDLEAVVDEEDQAVEDAERTADPDLGAQDAAEAPIEPQNPVDPDASEGAT
jgi:hypothetical protein